MRERGVVLRSWRVGTDAMKEAERILKDAERRSKGSVGNDRAGKR
jgi:hypothetical protein